VKCMQSMLFIKPLGFQGNPWRQDETAIPTRDRFLTGAWIPNARIKEESQSEIS